MNPKKLYKNIYLKVIDIISGDYIYFQKSIPLLKKALKARDELFN